MSKRLVLSLAACAALLAPALAGATSYYVSPHGNDANDGMSTSTPWRTLTKASSIVYGPGDALYLRRGGRWNGQTLNLRGGGTQFAPAFVAPYGPNFPATNRPRISPGTVNSTALRIDGGGGWIISGLELSSARWGVELRYDNVVDRDFVNLEDLYIHDMTNIYNPVDYEKYNFVSAGIAIRHWTDDPSGPTFLRNLTVRNVHISNANFAVWTGSICDATSAGLVRCNSDGFSTTGLWAYLDGFLFEDVHVVNGPQYGLSLLFVKNGTVRNSSVQNVGYQGWQYGTAGSLIAWASNVVFDKFDIFNVYRGYPPYDGCGFDFEGGAHNVTYRNSLIDTSDGAAFCIFDNGGNAGPNHDMLLENVSVTRFGRNPGNHEQGVIFALSTPSGQHTGVARNMRFHDAYNRTFIASAGYPQQWSTTDPSAAFYFENPVFARALPVPNASAHSWDPAFPPSNAIDGNPATSWRMSPTATLPQSFWVDLQADRTIRRIELLFPEYTGWNFRLFGSNDGLQTLELISDQSTGFWGNSFVFEGNVGYHWLLVEFLAGGPPAALSEIRAFGH